MKTEREYLKENDFIANEYGNYVYGSGYHNVSLVHILQEYASIYANQKLDEASYICLDFEKEIISEKILNLKDHE